MTNESKNWDSLLDDDSEWDEPQPDRRPRSERRQRGAVISVRMNPEELAEVQRRADQAGKSVGAYVRDQALASTLSPMIPAKFSISIDQRVEEKFLTANPLSAGTMVNT